MSRKHLARRQNLTVHHYSTGENLGCISDTYLLMRIVRGQFVRGITLTNWKTGKSTTHPIPAVDPQILANTLTYHIFNPAADESGHIATIRDLDVHTKHTFVVPPECSPHFLIYPFIDGILWIADKMYICDDQMLPDSKTLSPIEQDMFTDCPLIFANSQILIIEHADYYSIAYPAMQPRSRMERHGALTDHGFITTRFTDYDVDECIVALNPVHNQYILTNPRSSHVYDITQTSSPAREIPMSSLHVEYLDPNLIVWIDKHTISAFDLRATLPAYTIPLEKCGSLRTSVYSGPMATCCVGYEKGVAIID